MKKPIIVLTVTVLAAVLAVFVLAAFAVTRSSQSTTGIPLGPNDLPSSLYAKPYTGSKLLLTPAHAIDTLRALHTSGMRVIIRLAGRQENYQNADGSFSLEKWKAQIDRSALAASRPAYSCAQAGVAGQASVRTRA
jgi:ABC-type oligopeptide transport system substrate-binding subunit